MDLDVAETKQFLYHGSDVAVAVPRIICPCRHLDFGNGFYTTTDIVQAYMYAQKIVKIRHSIVPTVSKYWFDSHAAEESCRILKFGDVPTGDWLDFVTAQRMGRYNGDHYDIIMGPISMNKLYRSTIYLYKDGLITRDMALGALNVRSTSIQIAFTSAKGLSFLHFEGFAMTPQNVAT